jgi:MFS family permease
VSRRLVPFAFLLYIVCYVDRVNVSFAALQMNLDLQFSATVYGLGAGFFFVGYVLFQVPANLMLARIGARRWIAANMVAWGVLAAAMSLVNGPGRFYVLRVLLGVAEAGFFPGMLLYFTAWFPSGERARAVSRFMTAIPVASPVGAGSDRTNERYLHIALPVLAGSAALLAAVSLHSPVLVLVALSLFTATPMAMYGPFWALPPRFLRGTARRGRHRVHQLSR